MIDTELGHWTEQALRLKPRGTGEWVGLAGRAYTYMIGKRPMATIRRQLHGGWIGRIEGFEWTITSEMGAARFQAIPTTTPLTHTPAKLFRTVQQAKAEIERILAERPNG